MGRKSINLAGSEALGPRRVHLFASLGSLRAPLAPPLARARRSAAAQDQQILPKTGRRRRSFFSFLAWRSCNTKARPDEAKLARWLAGRLADWLAG